MRVVYNAFFIIICIVAISGFSGAQYEEGLRYLSLAKEASENAHHREALGYHQQALAKFRELHPRLDIRSDIAWILKYIGQDYLSLGLMDLALQSYKESLQLFQELNDWHGITRVKGDINCLLGTKAYKEGRFEEALENHLQALAKFRIIPKLSPMHDIALMLNYVGRDYLSLGQMDSAIESHQQALTIFQDLDEIPETANVLIDIGFVYWGLGKYEQALQSHEDALSKFQNLQIPELRAKALSGIGLAYGGLGKWKEALEKYQEALEIFRQTNLWQQTVDTLIQVGGVYTALGKHQQAQQHFKDAFKTATEHDSKYYIAIALNAIGVCYMTTSEYNKALDSDQKALKIFQELNDQVSIVKVRNDIAIVYIIIGRFKNAMEIFQEALIFFSERDIPSAKAWTIFSIGSAYRRLGKLDQALENYYKALDVFQNIQDSSGTAMVLNDLGAVYSDLGRYDEAFQKLKEAIDLCTKSNAPQGVLKGMINIAHTYEEVGRLSDALQTYKEAQLMAEKMHFPAENLSIINNLAVIHIIQNDYSEALSVLQEAIKIARELEIPDMTATILHNIASVYLSQKKYREAERAIIEAIDEYKRIDIKWLWDPSLLELYLAKNDYQKVIKELGEIKLPSYTADPFSFHYLTLKGLAFKGVGRFNEAAIELERAVTLSEKMRRMVREEKTWFIAAGPGGGRIRAYRNLVDVLSQLAIFGKIQDEKFISYGKEFKSTAFYFAELTKARSLLEAMAKAAWPSLRSQLSPDLKKEEEDIHQQLSAIEALLEEAYLKGLQASEELVSSQKSLQERLQAFIRNLRNRKEYQLYTMLQYPMPIRGEEMALRENEVLLEFAITEEIVYGFFVDRGGVKKVWIIKKKAEELKKIIDSFLEKLHNESDYKTKAKALYQLLLMEGLRTVPRDSCLIIVPDGFLGTLPFEALMMDNEEFVGSKYKIIYSQSASVFAFSRAKEDSKAPRSIFLIGNTSVYHVEEEVKLIAEQMGASNDDILKGPNIAKAQLLQKPLKDYRYLHFATHGSYLSKEPYLQLGSTGNKEDSLTLADVLQFNLDANLVVLSACKSGAGEIIAGEGIMNFARAFHQVGARRIMISLWNVHSGTTKKYMQIFYSYLKQGKSIREASFLTKQNIREENPHPFYWAPFVLYGGS